MGLGCMLQGGRQCGDDVATGTHLARHRMQSADKRSIAAALSMCDLVQDPVGKKLMAAARRPCTIQGSQASLALVVLRQVTML